MIYTVSFCNNKKPILDCLSSLGCARSTLLLINLKGETLFLLFQSHWSPQFKPTSQEFPGLWLQICAGFQAMSIYNNLPPSKWQPWSLRPQQFYLCQEYHKIFLNRSASLCLPSLTHSAQDNSKYSGPVNIKIQETTNVIFFLSLVFPFPKLCAHVNALSFL